MNLLQTIDFMQATASKPAMQIPLSKHFDSQPGGEMECKLCSKKVKGGATGAAAHLLEFHSEIKAREFSQKQRKKLAKSGKALPDGGFPIVNENDLENAKRAIGRAGSPAAARRHINERAKEMGEPGIGGKKVSAGGPGSGRHPEGGRQDVETLANKHKPHAGMCNLGNPVCRAYVDMRIKDPNWTPSGPRKAVKADAVPTEFAPSSRLNQPAPAGTAERDAETFKGPGKIQGKGFRIKPPFKIGGKCGPSGSSHGFHRGPSYEHKAAEMGHRLTLSGTPARRKGSAKLSADRTGYRG